MAAGDYVLYGAKGSGSASVEAALHLAGLPYRIVEAAQWLPESAYADLLKVNPLGQIPTLVLPDGQVLTESAAILMHLGGLAAPGVLMPVDAAQRARILRGLVFIPANCYSAITILDYPERFLEPADDATKEALRAGTRKRLHLHWELFADQFGGGGAFLHGEAPGALDLFAAVVSRWSGTRKHLEQQRPAFHALLKRIDSHPQVAPVFRRHWDN